MMEYVLTLLVEQYGPIAVLTAVLWHRQNALRDAVLTLADEQPAVDTERVRKATRPLSRGD